MFRSPCTRPNAPACIARTPIRSLPVGLVIRGRGLRRIGSNSGRGSVMGKRSGPPRSIDIVPVPCDRHHLRIPTAMAPLHGAGMDLVRCHGRDGHRSRPCSFRGRIASRCLEVRRAGGALAGSDYPGGVRSAPGRFGIFPWLDRSADLISARRRSHDHLRGGLRIPTAGSDAARLARPVKRNVGCLRKNSICRGSAALKCLGHTPTRPTR